jgi:hypothetical protein
MDDVLAYQIDENLQNRLDNNFKYHAPTPDQVARYQIIRDKAKEFAHTICTFCPQSRELSLALTQIEEATMFANAAIARNE